MGLISRVSSRTYRTLQIFCNKTTNKKNQKMGRVRTKTVKKASRRIIEKYYTRLTLDYYTNARIVQDIASIPTKRLKNQIAGFITHTMKRIQKGPVRGISIKLQEEERERRDNYVPETSALKGACNVDNVTAEMIKKMGLEINDLKASN